MRVQLPFSSQFRPFSGTVDTADSKFVAYRFKSDKGYLLYFEMSLDDGMVDVSDLGSEFWQFESASG
jgi:hypothetical protein